MPEPGSVLVLACGALARELLDIMKLNAFDHVKVECLPAALHNHPDRIPDAVASRLDAVADRYEHVFVGYADCGTGGLLDKVLEARGVERLPGAHCYEFFATAPVFADLHEAEIGTLYLTDYLVKHFDRIIIRGLGIDRHPELRDMYFGNYTRVLYLAQTSDPKLMAMAEHAAGALGLRFETRFTGYGDLKTTLVGFTSRKAG